MVADPHPTTWASLAVKAGRKDDTYLLPVATQFECKGSRVASNRSLQWGEQIVKPIFESKDDLEVMYLIAKKLGFADEMFKNIKVENNVPVAEDILREINRGSWSTGYCGQSPERLKAHMANQASSTWSRMRAPRTVRRQAATTTACRGRAGARRRSSIPARRCSTTPTSRSWTAAAPSAPRFGVEREEKLPDGTTRKVSLLADGSYSKDSEIKDGYPEFTLGVLKKLGWDKDLTEAELAVINKVNPTNAGCGVLVDSTCRAASSASRMKHGCIPYGNGKARMNAFGLPDPIPVHREPIYTPRVELVAKYPTLPDAKQFRLPNIGFSVQKAAVDKGIAKQFPLILTSGRLVEYEGGGEETRSNKWLAELQQDMFIEINPADAAERGIKDGGWVWVTGAENSSKAKVKALVTERVGKGVAWMPFHFGGWFGGDDLRAQLSEGRRSDRARRKRQHDHDLRLRSGDRHAGTQGHPLSDQQRHKEATTMARMKFLCDADRCIECNACVTACKNEHEVPWGINRRRVVTINDGKPGERSVSMACMHCTDAPCAAVCPVNCFYTTADARGAALQGPVHRLRLLLLRLPVRRAAISEGRQLRLARQDGQVHLLRRRPGGRRQQGGVREIRRQPPGRRQAAAVRRDVLDQVAAGRRRRDHRADLQGAGVQARLRLRRLGLADRLPRDHRDLIAPRRGGQAPRRRFERHSKAGRDGMTKFVAHLRVLAGALALVFVVALAAPAASAAAELGQSDRERGEGAAAAQAAQDDPGPRHHPGHRSPT